MITKAELEKMVEDEAKKHGDSNCVVSCGEAPVFVAVHAETIARHFKSGASFVSGILMPEIDRLNEDIKLHQKINTSDGNLIQSLKDENKRLLDKINKALSQSYNDDCCGCCDMRATMNEAITQKSEE